MAKKENKRYDSKRRLLKTGEYEKEDGQFLFRWTDSMGKRHSIGARTLEELRKKEEEIQVNRHDGIRTEAMNIKVNDVYKMWSGIKRGLKDNTFQNYKYMYDTFVAPDLGQMKIRNIKKSDVKRFYNMLADERGLRVNTIDNIHTVLHQVLEMAVEDGYLRTNVSDNVLKELKQSHNAGNTHKKALTIPEQDLFENFLKEEQSQYHHWYPIFAVMLGTGMRVGEVTGLRWCDVDLEEGIIDVNHTLVYYNHTTNGCYFNIHTPKTEAGKRKIPMLDSVKKAFIAEKLYQEKEHICCKAIIDGYTDFIFVNRFGNVQHQGTLNKALRRIIRDCNDEVLLKNPNAKVLLPRFSCHSLRHTFTTRLVESGVNIKVVQDVLGHKDIATTLDIYTDVTRELAKREFDDLESKIKKNQMSVKPGDDKKE